MPVPEPEPQPLVLCPHSSAGCPFATYSPAEVASHLDECGFVGVSCQFCRESVLRRDMPHACVVALRKYVDDQKLLLFSQIQSEVEAFKSTLAKQLSDSLAALQSSVASDVRSLHTKVDAASAVSRETSTAATALEGRIAELRAAYLAPPVAPAAGSMPSHALTL